jgi:hypothetical protein
MSARLAHHLFLSGVIVSKRLQPGFACRGRTFSFDTVIPPPFTLQLPGLRRAGGEVLSRPATPWIHIEAT